MAGPITVGIVVSLTFLYMSVKRPNLGRIVLGVFFLLMAFGVNGTITLTNPQSYVTYGQGALIPFYREITLKLIALNPMVFGLLLILYEAIVGVFILFKGTFVKIGLIGVIIFVISITPVSLMQLPWLLLVLTPAYLLTKDFPGTNWDGTKHSSRPTRNIVQGSPENTVYTMAGVAALVSTLCSLMTLVVVGTLGGEPSTAQEYFSVLQDNKLVGLLRMDFASVVNVAMYFFLFFGLYTALREINPAGAALATALIYIGVTLWLSSHSGMSLIHLSDRFAEATTATERSQLLIIGEATIASDMWHTTGALVGGILMQTAAVGFSVLMLSGRIFSKATAYIGILAHGLDLIHILFGIFAPTIGNLLMFIAGPLYLIWFPLVSLRLIQIGRRGVCD